MAIVGDSVREGPYTWGKWIGIEKREIMTERMDEKSVDCAVTPLARSVSLPLPFRCVVSVLIFISYYCVPAVYIPFPGVIFLLSIVSLPFLVSP